MLLLFLFKKFLSNSLRHIGLAAPAMNQVIYKPLPEDPSRMPDAISAIALAML